MTPAFFGYARGRTPRRGVRGRWWADRRLLAGALVGLVAVAALGAGRLNRARAPGVPLGEVTRGAYVEHLQLRGEFRPRKSLTLSAPSQAGEILILKLVRNGTVVRKGDVLAEFDSASVQRTLDQKRSELKQAQAEISRSQAQARIREEQDATELMKARYDLSRAKLDVTGDGLLARVEVEKRKLAVADAEQKLREVEQKLSSDRTIGVAEAASARQKAEKARFEVEQAERNLAALTMRAPAAGLVTLLPNFRASGPFGTAGEFKPGDRAWPGAPIAELPDLSTIQALARIDEADRSRLKVGLPVSVRVDALPDVELEGRVASISALAKPDFTSWPATRNFDLLVALARGDQRLRGGMNAAIRVELDRVADSIVVPSRGIFQKGARSVVYVFTGSSFDERSITIARRNREQAAVSGGVSPGERVALKDPTAVGEGGRAR